MQLEDIESKRVLIRFDYNVPMKMELLSMTLELGKHMEQ